MTESGEVEVRPSAKPATRGVAHVLDATRYSAKGLIAAVRHEEAFRLELVAFAVALPVALWLGQSGIERALLVSALLLVLIMELVNSAIEAVVDRVGSERHPLSGRAKDIGSAAVFLSLINAATVWGFVLATRYL